MVRTQIELTDPRTVFRQCERFLGGGSLPTPAEELSRLAQEVAGDARGDHYAEGEIVQDFEREIAELLGKEAAMVCPTGVMAQQIALRIWSERKGSRTVVFHPMCHMETREAKAYQLLHGLHARLVGSPRHLLTLEDLQAVAEPAAALLLELPQRDLGGQLPAWEELEAQVALARERGWAVHLDGARIWQAGPFYQRPYAEIAALFDSVYVSFYKDLRALAGAALAGPADVIAEAHVWRRRHGGELFQYYPQVVSARLGLREQLPRMAEYAQRARHLAGILRAIPGIVIKPDPPQTNMMHIYLHGDREALMERAMALAREEKVALFSGLREAEVPDWSMFEETIADTENALSDDEVREYVMRVLAPEPAPVPSPA
jgi:threonine aldolase